ncbi:hypothetical protein J22TS3_26980 [Paenibacillus sp. J22TS3]|nr:hypothetical protein J22TS3_26980 [Paenibacillus sp. J22TS3]
MDDSRATSVSCNLRNLTATVIPLSEGHSAYYSRSMSFSFDPYNNNVDNRVSQ